MLENLHWRPLDQRRIDTRLVIMYKITYGLVIVPVGVLAIAGQLFTDARTKDCKTYAYLNGESAAHCPALKEYPFSSIVFKFVQASIHS